MENRYAEIEGVLTYIHQHLFEPLTLDQLARYAAYSPFHFSRLFKERVGLSPQYYISSLRLQKSKDLLLNTHLTIRDVALEIGQQSLGTFTTRFTERVGMTPSEFRNSRHDTVQRLRALQMLDEWHTAYSVESSSSVIEGTVTADVPFNGVILIGLFAKPIPEGLPLYGTLLPSLGRFRFCNVSPGTYYVMATSVSWNMQAADILLTETTLRSRTKAPIIVNPYSSVPYQEVKLYPPSLDDPPILISQPLLMNRFLSRKFTPTR
ncbi:helix-turn-helix transcriptional regulator [Marinicrinis lubricantis]